MRILPSLVLMAAAAALHAEPVRLILDTDMGNDVDDVMALSMIHSLQRRGACELLAVTLTKDHPLAAPFVPGVSNGKLADYRWSSLSCYAMGKGPQWLEMERGLKSFDLAESGRDRRAYVGWLEARAARAAKEGGNIDQKAQDALRRGW